MGFINNTKEAISQSLADKRPYRVADEVPANTTYSDNQYSFTVSQPGRIEGLKVRIYPGPELDLRIRIKKVTLDGIEESLIRFVGDGKEYVDGDDDVFVFDVQRAVASGEQILIEAENVDLSNGYDFAVDFVIDYEVGIESDVGVNF